MILEIKKRVCKFGDVEWTNYQAVRVIPNGVTYGVSKIYTTKRSAVNFIKRVELGDTSLMDDYLMDSSCFEAGVAE
tara:strand:- start:277 stop:504 length:228 start_codon:yes stop_codon:yes gene_type:complete